jgi:spore germination protein YaaH
MPNMLGRPITRALVLVTSLTLVGLGNLTPTIGSAATAPASPATGDPAVGPHVRDELAHISDRVAFAPAGAAILPRARRPSNLAAAATPAAATTFSNGTLLKEVFGFAPYWNLAQNPNWNYNLISTVAYFGLGINSDGMVNTSADDPGYAHWANDGNVTTIINNAHAVGDAVVLVIKPWNRNGMYTADTVNAIVTSETARQHAIADAITYMQSKKLDGINVDFEGTTTGFPGAQAGFTTFIQEMSTAVHAAGATLSVDTYSGSASWDGGLFKIGDLAASVDAFFVMAYDMGFSDIPGHAAPNAPLNGWQYNDTLSVNQYLGKAPASKIILGVPYYGYKYCTVDTSPNSALIGATCPDPGQANKTSSIVAVTYTGIYDDFACALNLNKNLLDATAMEPWATWDSPATGDPCGANHGSTRELYYDDANSIGNKYDLVIQSGIRGAGMWALGNDGSYPDLWTVIKDKFATLSGYWLAASDGGIFALGTTPFYGSMGGRPLNAAIVGMARTPDKAGYWLVASDGGIFTFGDAKFFGSMGSVRLTRPIVGIAATPTGQGYWLVASDGGIFSFGDAAFHGSMGGQRLSKPMVGMASTPTGQGYWLVAADGGIFTFGDAAFKGSTGSLALTKPIVRMAATPTGQGYWLAASDGGVFTFGDASFKGSTGGTRLNAPIAAMAPTLDAGGYWLVASDGGIFTFGDARFVGSLGRLHLNAPIVDAAVAS